MSRLDAETPRPAPVSNLHRSTPERGSEPNPFGRLVRLVRENDRLLGQLRKLKPQMASARAYLAEPDCHEPLGSAQLDRLRRRYSGTLTLLRSNRITAAEFLGPDPGPHAPGDADL